MILSWSRKNSLRLTAKTKINATARTSCQFIQQTSYHLLPHFPVNSDLLHPFRQFLQWNHGYVQHLIRPFRVVFLLSSTTFPSRPFLFVSKVSWPKSPPGSLSIVRQTRGL